MIINNISGNKEGKFKKRVHGIRGGSRTVATSKMERFVIIVNGWKQNGYYLKALHLGCCSSSKSASGNVTRIHVRTIKH